MNSTTLLIEHVWNMEENKIKGNDDNIIQILSVTVMKYHVSLDMPRELYFPKGLYFPEVRSTEGKYCPEGKYNYLGTTDR